MQVLAKWLSYNAYDDICIYGWYNLVIIPDIPDVVWCGFPTGSFQETLAVAKTKNSSYLIGVHVLGYVVGVLPSYKLHIYNNFGISLIK